MTRDLLVELKGVYGMFRKHGWLLFLLVAFLTVGCALGSEAVPGRETIEVTDSTGHTLALEGLPERVVIAGKATVMVQDTVFLFEEAEERVVALENRKQSAFSFLPVVDPGLEEKEMLEMNAGPEQITAVQPDLVIMKNFLAESLGAPLEDLGIATLYLNLENPEVFYQDVKALGKVFGAPERAEEIVVFYQDRVDKVEAMTADLEEGEKPRVLVLEYSDRGGETAFSVPPVSWLQTRMVELAGGIPVWRELEASGGWTIVTLDQIAAWDPDQIFIIDYQGNADQVTENLREDPIWRNLRAVQNDQLFAFAFDFYSWDQPDTRWILGLQWLSTKIQPELTSDIDIRAEVQAFYQTLYRMDEAAVQDEVMPLLRGDIQ